MARFAFEPAERRKTPLAKLGELSPTLLLLIGGLAAVGFTALYSAAKGSVDPWALRQAIRFGMGLFLLVLVALIDIRWWLRFAYPLYFASLALLVAVELVGQIGMGAQRWIDLGFIRLQPSEAAKIGLVLALARYYHGLSHEESRRIWSLFVPALLIAAPIGLVAIQPDLGTAVILGAIGAAMLFLAGVPLWLFGGGLALAAAAIPIAWPMLEAYQRQRVMTFLNPESDPLGAGWNIIQSKIALGSGGVDGKGFLNGTQAHLDFLPESHTDFIFTLWAEEFGLVGGLFVLGLYFALCVYGYVVAARARSLFGRLLAIGLTVNLFLYVAINIGMVMGLLPVVGVPLPLMSYGGTVMLTTMIGFGLILSVLIHRDQKLSRGEAALLW